MGLESTTKAGVVNGLFAIYLIGPDDPAHDL